MPCMNALLVKNVAGISNGWADAIVHKNANPNPPKEKPVTKKPKNIIVNTFQHILWARDTEPSRQM